MTTFHRHLSDRARRALAPHLPLVAAWLDRPGAAFHLRRGDCAAFMWWGQRAVALEGLAGRATAHPFGADAVPLDASLPQVLHAAADRVDEHLRRTRSSSAGELALQAGLVSALHRSDADFLVLDEQVQVPRAALADPSLAGLRVDLALVERATGDLWLVEVKPADAADLDGPVLQQLDRTRGLPGALHGGALVFVQALAQVLAQKAELGLLAAAPPTPSGAVRSASLSIGDPAQAAGRVACWTDGELRGLEGLLHGHVAADCAPTRDAFRPLLAARDAALAGPRVAHAPRRSRWNTFTAQQDHAQAVWRRRAPSEPQLGPFQAQIEGYIAQHGVRAHAHLDHPRSSQAACLQLFAPARWGDAQGALAAVLDGATPEGLRIEGLDAVDFEAPHVDCDPADCAVAADMAALVGEHTGRVVTGLDALVRARGRRDGRPVRVLIAVEFKYSEVEFGCCGGFVSRAFDEAGRRACVDRPAARRVHCHLLVKHRRGYLQDTSMFVADPLEAPGPCLLLGPVNQPYRSHFTARALAASLGFEEVVYAVVADARNPALNQPARPLPGHRSQGAPLDAYRAALRPELAGGVIELSAQDLVAAYRAAAPTEPWLEALVDRYGW